MLSLAAAALSPSASSPLCSPWRRGSTTDEKNAIQGSDYSAVLATMLLAIVTMVNVFISAMPSSVTEYDISTGKL